MRDGRSAGAAIRQCRCWSREECLHLGIRNSLGNFTSFISIASMSCNLPGKVVLQHERVCCPRLAEKVIPVVHNHVGSRTSNVLRAGGCGKRRRARSRAEHICSRQQGRSKKVTRNQAPASGNTEFVITE